MNALRFPYTLLVKPTKTNGLNTDSVALIFQIGALDVKRFQKKIGILENSYLKRIDDSLRNLLKL